MESRGELDLSCAPEKLVVTLTVKAGRNTLKVFFHSTGSEVECTGHFESVTKTLLTKVQSVYTFRMHFESMIGVPESVQVRFLSTCRDSLQCLCLDWGASGPLLLLWMLNDCHKFLTRTYSSGLYSPSTTIKNMV